MTPPRSPLRVLSLSSVFPNPAKPVLGVFVRQRLKHLAAYCQLQVVAPIPWFPLNRWLRAIPPRSVPARRTDEVLVVHHPRFLCPPAAGKVLDASLYFLGILPSVLRLRGIFPFDLIDAHFSYPDGVAAVLLARTLGCPATITLRGPHDLRHAAYRLRRAQIASALRHASRVIAVTSQLADFAHQLGADPRKIRVIPNGVDPLHFRPRNSHEARSVVGLPHDRTILLTVGALIERKGQHRILDLLPALTAQRPDLMYVCVGGDPSGGRYRSRLERLASCLNLNDHVRFVGERPHEHIPFWMASADLFCLATSAEGSCNVLREALACGVPVVATDVDANAELISAWQNGVLAPYWDPAAFQDVLLRALDYRWDRQAIATRMQRDSWDSVAKRVFEEFRMAMQLRP